MSTATTISVIDKDKNYIGGSIIPGLRIAMDSLSKNTSQLPRISLEPPAHIIGKNTVECMESGAVYGNACMLEGMIHRIQKELGSPATLVATGKIAKFVIPLCRHPIIYDGDLTLKGLSIIYEKNKKPEKKEGTLHRQAKRKAPCAKERNEGT